TSGYRVGDLAVASCLRVSTVKDVQCTFPLISSALTEVIERRNLALFFGEAEALVALGDERGLTVFQELSKKPGVPPQLSAAISGFESRLRSRLTPAKSNP